MGMVTTTLMYTMGMKAQMEELGKLSNPYEQWHDYRFLFTTWPSVDFMFHYGFLVDEQHEPKGLPAPGGVGPGRAGRKDFPEPRNRVRLGGWAGGTVTCRGPQKVVLCRTHRSSSTPFCWAASFSCVCGGSRCDYSLALSTTRVVSSSMPLRLAHNLRRVLAKDGRRHGDRQRAAEPAIWVTNT
jgi:hypothetical protein